MQQNLTSVSTTQEMLTALVGQQAETNPSEGEAIFRVLTVIAARKRLVAALTITGTLIAAGIALITPNVYTATAVIMPPQQAQSTAVALLGSLGPLAGVASRELGLKNPADLYLGLLASRTITDHLIGRFHLKEVFHVKTNAEARLALQQHRRFIAGRDSLIHVEVEDTDPKRAAALANGFIDELNQQNRRLATTDAGSRRLFLEEQLGQEKKSLADAEEALKITQTRTGVVQMDAQARIALTSIAELRAQITSREATLQRIRLSSTPQNPEVIAAEAELSTMRNQLRQLGGNSADRSVDPMMPTSALPQAGLNYVRKLRDVKYHEFLFEMLSKQYEAARLDESKSAPPLQIVDAAVVPERKSGPPRTMLTLIGFLVSAVIGCGAATLLNWFRSTGTLDKLRRLSSNTADSHPATK